MTVAEVMKKLEQLGTEQTKKTFLRHGAKEPPRWPQRIWKR